MAPQDDLTAEQAAKSPSNVVKGVKGFVSIPFEQRFWQKVIKGDHQACWIWTGSTDGDGYGQIYRDGKLWRAPRIAYEFVHGPIPHGLHIDHLCRNHACVNPHHLEAVTPLENWRRGIAPSAANANKTRCIRGHKFTPENTRIREDGRSCIACTKMRNAEATRKRKLDRLASEGG